MAWVKTANLKGEPAPNQVSGSVGGVAAELVLWIGTQAQYTSIAVKDTNTVYVVI